MQLLEDLKWSAPERETILTIGVFDGVHLGHQHLIASLREQASKRGLLSCAITFREHPQVVLSPQSKLTYLTTLEERTYLLKSLGVEFIAVLSFTWKLSQLPARQFMTLLQDQFKMQGLVIGLDFALGRGKEGDATALQALGRELHFTVEVVPPLMLEGQIVSSTAIRAALAQGDVSLVRELLGRFFSLTGEVTGGDGRGRLLGFPTANLALSPDQALPKDGIYATRVHFQSNYCY